MAADAARSDVLIVGAGHAGVQLAVGLAKVGGGRRVVLIGDEPGLPYERPPLTKRLLYGEDDPSPVPLRSADYWARSTVELRTGVRVVDVDHALRRVRTSDGTTTAYGALVWAAGGRAAASGLPGADLDGVHSLRTFADLARLRSDLVTARCAVIIGGGYVGLETASALRERGVAVTLVELAPRVLARVTGPTVSQFFTTLHRGHGVDVRVGVGVSCLLERGGRVGAVVLADGTELAADIVVIGVGMRPEVGPLLAAGAAGDAGGLEVDHACRTSLPDVYAIGDCAKQVSPWSDAAGAVRIESVHNAGHHAAAVTRVLSGLPVTDPPPPRFWSTQFGHELRAVGLRSPSDEPVLRGDLTSGSFSVAYLRDGRLAAIDMINRPRDFARAQALVASHWRPTSRVELADPDVELPRPLATQRPVLA